MPAVFAFHKYQALGNDYLVLDVGPGQVTPELIRGMCDRHFGVGADGVLVRVGDGGDAGWRLRIFNSDGSEAEKSGNRLRIFARYLWDQGWVTEKSFDVTTLGGVVTCQVAPGGERVTVSMGQAQIGDERPLEVGDRSLVVTPVSLGNPHCVILTDVASADEARALGPYIERHPVFQNRTNVQFVQVLSRSRLRLEIWERGSGYTLASGSSACAAAAVVRLRGQCDDSVTVEMPGGELQVDIAADGTIRQSGPVGLIAWGKLQLARWHA